MKKTIELIKKFNTLSGPSGYEDEVKEELKKSILKLGIKDITESSLGSLVVKIGTGKKKVMLAGHMDEIGVLCTFIDKEGFLRFSPVGGVSKYGLIGTRIQFINGVSGIIGSELLKKPEDFSLEKLFIDIGARDLKSAEELVPVGTFGVFKREVDILGTRVAAKAHDDRIGCIVMLEVLERIFKKKLPYTLYFVFTVQEEVGLRGARVSAYGIEPDFGIALDVTGTGDTPSGYKMAVKLGGGVAIKVKDSSIITHPKLKDLLINISKKNKIPYQLEILEYGGTDAGAIHLTKSGIPSTVLSIPTRYVHSQSELIDLNDVKATEDLLEKVLTTPDLGNLK
ncbi:MAG TPA: M42 family peptidase, partial [Firmicutes bacterium]|nr:M42 family peptidase [Bacillota bacterium]